MITQEKFDTAYERIVQMRLECEQQQQYWTGPHKAGTDRGQYHIAEAREQAFRQVLAILENADTDESTASQ